MLLTKIFLNELEMEAASTRKMLAIVPDDKYDWRPHPKSMTIRALATHVAEIPGWISSVMQNDVLDFANTPYNPKVINNTSQLLAHFDECVAAGKEVLVDANESKLNNRWIMKSGDDVFMDLSKAEAIRHSLSQHIHHRAQLGVFLRLLNIPIPGVYGPSADEMGM
ncbi:MAG TPA: damage-inducible protein DinB [Ignavibacteriales bacterium]|nr:damage-inducible protein DinB [Ignavibacteriales bacterium]